MHNRDLAQKLLYDQSNVVFPLPKADEVQADVEAMLKSFSLYEMRRYYKQRYWEKETTDAEYSDRIEQGLKLENVAAHSWHVCDLVMLFGAHFDNLCLERSVMMAVLHDKLEIFVGDWDPLDVDESGNGGHAFDRDAQQKKRMREESALIEYTKRINTGAGKLQKRLIEEYAEGSTLEARFVKSIDKIQALAYIYAKKEGNIPNEQLSFILRYTSQTVRNFPGLIAHYRNLVDRIIISVSQYRCVNKADLESELFSQLELDLREQ